MVRFLLLLVLVEVVAYIPRLVLLLLRAEGQRPIFSLLYFAMRNRYCPYDVFSIALPNARKSSVLIHP